MGKPADEVWSLLKETFGQKTVVTIALICFGIIGAAYARAWADEAMDRKLSPILKKQERYEEDIHEFAKDLRELYRVSPTRRSERLERPFPSHVDDGGEQ